MEGPIELELQNSLLWNDAWSLPVDLIRKELTANHSVPYSLQMEKQLLAVYVLDQINLALSQDDIEKVKKLIQLYTLRKGGEKNGSK
jgi:hypothetical protein